jgi:hypothetical protein
MNDKRKITAKIESPGVVRAIEKREGGKSTPNRIINRAVERYFEMIARGRVELRQMFTEKEMNFLATCDASVVILKRPILDCEASGVDGEMLLYKLREISEVATNTLIDFIEFCSTREKPPTESPFLLLRRLN